MKENNVKQNGLPRFEQSIVDCLTTLNEAAAVDIALKLYPNASDLRSKVSQVSVSLKRLEQKGVVEKTRKAGRKSYYRLKESPSEEEPYVPSFDLADVKQPLVASQLHLKPKLSSRLTLFIVVVLLFSIITLGFPLSGLLVKENILSYQQEMNWNVNESSNLSWSLSATPQDFYVRSIKFSGALVGNGSAQVFIENDKGQRYTILDSSTIRFSASNVVTGRITENITENLSENVTVPITNENIEANLTEIQNETEEANLTQNITEEANETNTTENITAETIELPKKFVFYDLCVDTCFLTFKEGFKESSYRLVVEVENATLIINSISYTLENTTKAVEAVPAITPTMEVIDAKGRPVEVRYNIHEKTPAKKVGIESAKKKVYDIEISPQNNPIKKVYIENVELSEEHKTVHLDIDDAPETAMPNAVEVYAIDPTAINFTTATVTVTAKGNELYKCKNWDFAGRKCTDGNWVKLMNIVPGQDYSFTLTPEDPGFGENATGTPSSTLAFFMSSENMVGNALTDANDFDECPISLNDYGTTTEKCGFWNCTALAAAAGNGMGKYCSGLWNCTVWNGVTCAQYNCTNWGETTILRRDIYCSNGWNCTAWSGSFCKSWNCTTHTQYTVADTDKYCSGLWNCTVWNGTSCGFWNCSSWTDAATTDTDHFCSGGWNCTGGFAGTECGTWNCTGWGGGTAADTLDRYCSGVINCTQWNGNACSFWNCTARSAATTTQRDVYCESFNCTNWNTTTKACGTWNCTKWTQSGVNQKDYYCSGVYNCTAWETFTYDTVPNTTLNSPAENYYNATASPAAVTFNCSATDDNQLKNISLYITNSTNQSFSLNQTTNISGISNSTNWTLSLINGNYTWNCLSYDNASQSDWGDANRTLKINYTVDTTPPQWSNNQSNTSATYSPTTLSQFNITWTDNVAVDKVLIEGNWSGSAVNYSMSNNTGTWNIYSFSANLPAGTHYWKSYANDTLGNSNSTNNWTFTIAKANNPVTLLLNGSAANLAVTYGQTSNATASATVGTVYLYKNGTLVTSGASPLSEVAVLGVGLYIYKANATGNTNYSDNATGVTYNLTVNKAPTLTRLFLNGTEGNRTYTVGETANFTVTVNVSGATVYLDTNISGWTQQSGVTPLTNLTTLSQVGYFNITGSFPGNANYSASSATYYANVTAVPNTAPQINLNLPANNAQFNNTQNVNFNFTAIDDYNTTMNCSIYLDNVLNQTNSSTVNNTLTNLIISGISYGSHNWKMNCSDGSLTNVSGTRYFSINDTIAPQWSNPQKNETTVYWNDSVKFNTSWTDNWGLTGYIFSTNQTGSWANSSYVPFSGTANVSENISTITAAAGTNVSWYFWANDSAGNANQTNVQTFTVQQRPVSLAFSVNQSVYPQGRSPSHGYDVYIPFQVRYVDVQTGQPISDATCYVINNETADNVTLTYNAGTGNYTGQVNDYMMYDTVGFNATCSKANYVSAAKSTMTNVWWFNYLWEWTNTSYGNSDAYTTHWLRKENATGGVYTLTQDVQTNIGENNFPITFYFCGAGTNCSFLKNYNMQGLQTLRLNISINDTACKPFLCIHVHDWYLNELTEACGPEQSIPFANTPTVIEQNVAHNYTIEQNDYLGLLLHLNCSSAVSEQINIYYNYTDEPANVEIHHPEPKEIVSYIATWTHLEPSYTVNPNGTANVTRKWWITFNNTASNAQYLHYWFKPQILVDYPNSNIDGTIYVYNSTGQLWASDNATAGVPEVATSHSDNQVDWHTEVVPASTSVNETLQRDVLNAIRDTETLLYGAAAEKQWQVRVWTVFIPQVTIYNITAWTNYSTYGVPDDWGFEVNVTNSSGTFNITSQTTINTTAKTLTFQQTNLGEVYYTILAKDKTPPTYSNLKESPTDPATYSPGQIYQFNATWTDNIKVDTAILEFNGVNYTASNVSSEYYRTLTNLVAGAHNYIWYANDSANNWNSTGALTYTVNKATTTLTLSASPSWTETYGTQTNVSCVADNGEVAVKLYRNGSDVTAENNGYVLLGAGTWNYTCNNSATQNYTANETSNLLSVAKADPTAYLHLAIQKTEGNASVVYPTTTNATSWATLSDNQDLAYNLWRDYNMVASGDPASDIGLLGGGTYVYVYNTTGGANYTGGTTPPRNLTVNKGSVETMLYINDSRSDDSFLVNEMANFTVSTNVSGRTVELWTNFSDGAYKRWAGPSLEPLSSLVSLNTLGYFYWTGNFSGDANYTADTEVWYTMVASLTMYSTLDSITPSLINIYESSDVVGTCKCLGGLCNNGEMHLQTNASGTWSDIQTTGQYTYANTSYYSLDPFTGNKTKSWNVTANSTGNFALRIRCNSTETADASSTPKFLYVQENVPPTIENITASPSTATPGSNITISAKVTDQSGIKSVNATIKNESGYIISTLILTDPDIDNIYTDVWDSTGAQEGSYLVDVNATDTYDNVAAVGRSATIALSMSGVNTYTNIGISVPANQTTTIDASAIGVVLDSFSKNNVSNSTINLAKYTGNIKTTAGVETKGNLSVTDIMLGDDLKNNLSWMVIKIYYADIDVSTRGLDESTLRMYRWNGTKWNYVQSSVDTGLNYVSANVSEFSYYGIFGDFIQIIAPPTVAARPVGGAPEIPPKKPEEKPITPPGMVLKLDIVGMPTSININTQKFEVKAVLRNTGNLTLVGGTANIKALEGWQVSSPIIGDLKPDETQEFKITLTSTLCNENSNVQSVRSFLTPPKIVVEIRSVDVLFVSKEVKIPLNMQNFVIVVNENSLSTDKILVCFIINNLNAPAKRMAEIEFGMYHLNDRMVPVDLDYISPIKVGQNEIFITTKTYNLRYIPKGKYDLITSLYENGALFSPNYMTGRSALSVEVR